LGKSCRLATPDSKHDEWLLQRASKHDVSMMSQATSDDSWRDVAAYVKKQEPESGASEQLLTSLNAVDIAPP
jgi:hypothetical protein